MEVSLFGPGLPSSLTEAPSAARARAPSSAASARGFSAAGSLVFFHWYYREYTEKELGTIDMAFLRSGV